MGVVLAAFAGTGVLLAFRRRDSAASIAGVLAAMLVSSAMLGHNFARIGEAKLAAKPWLYFMQSGGLAIAFVIPALWVSFSRHGMGRLVPKDAVMWLAAYLTLGLVFYLV